MTQMSDRQREETRHIPVMLKPVLTYLNLQPGQVAVDGTLGLASHAIEMAKMVGPTGTLVATDWDTAMLTEAGLRLQAVDCRKELFHADYRVLPSILDTLNLRADGILLDLGVNSIHFDDASYGMSVTKEGPLDMRMDKSKGEPACDLLNRLSLHQIEDLLFKNADERWAKAIAKQIILQRQEEPLSTTTDLVNAVLAAIPSGARDKRIHPATRTFQAIRIAVNSEIEGLDVAIMEIAGKLSIGGSIVTLAYHSGEERCCKAAFRALSATGEFMEVTRKPEGPTADEIARNPRSRSAKLRCLRRII